MIHPKGHALELAGIGGPDATPAQLRADASTRLLGIVLEETNMAVVEPGARERAALYANLQRGTWKGELTRSVFLFKTTPISSQVSFCHDHQ